MSILKNIFKNEKVSDKTYISENTDFVVNTIKFLGIDMINKANSGHPGIVLGAAPIMYSLFRNHIIVDPEDPKYFNRDRFVLSAGHGSALLYPVLHLSGFKNPTLDDLKEFRQIGSKTPGHPENFHLDSVEATTGPLGQGVAEAVGMAIAETFLAEKYNISSSTQLIDHYTYCLFGDGDLQEGVAQEAIALAGRFKLNKLIMLYDSNDVQLDG
jgi:transketolase